MRVVIIGLGSIATRHIAALRELEPEVELFALRSRSPEVPRHNVTNFYDYADIPEIAPDFILLSNPTAHRAAVLERVIPLGIPLFVEKPALHALNPAPALVAQIEAARLKTYVACNLRFLDCLLFVQRELKKTGQIPNEVNVYCGSYLPDWRPGRDFRKMYSARPELGGGAHLDLIHELDYLYWLFGSPLRVATRRRAVSSLDIPATDYAHYLLDYPKFTAAVTLNYYRRDYKRQLELVLTEATWTVDLATNRVMDHAGKELFASPRDITDTYLPQMRHFLAYLNGNVPSKNSFAEGVEVLKIALNHV